MVGRFARAAAARGLATALEVEDAATFAPQLDPVPAAVSAGILVGAALFRRKVNGAIAARERSEEAAAALQRARVGALSGEFDGDLALLEAEVKALALKAEDARTISIAGLNARVMVPLPLGSAAPGVVARPSERERQPASQAGTTGAELRRILLALVLVAVVGAQLWLLMLMSADPMGGGGLGAIAAGMQ